MLKKITDKLKAAQSVILTTHRHCDGDGLGAELALFHALQALGKDVRILNVDRPAPKYAFLGTDRLVHVFDVGQPLVACDLALVFDTNDERLVEPLFSRLKLACREVLFIDHHPVLTNGPQPTENSVIDTSAASTGEVVFRLIKELGVPFDAKISRALYTSVVFDTQLFRFVKSDPRSHLMAAELLQFEKHPEDVHRQLFATYTVEKMAFLARSLSSVEYVNDGHLAIMQVSTEEMKALGLDPDESGDVIDLVMNIEAVEAAALIRMEGHESCKISLRSKGRVRVLGIAEKFGGGGHPYASGAYVRENGETVRERITKDLSDLLTHSNRTANA